jgi:integrase
MKATPNTVINLANEESYRHRPLWEMTQSEFDEFQVTSLSKGKDNVWRLQNTTPGQSKALAKLNWSLKLTDGSLLTDNRHTRRLAWAKKLVALILHAPADGIVPAAGSMGGYQQGLKWLISWMAMRGMHTPDELDVDEYLEDLPRYIAERSKEEEITTAQIQRTLKILPKLWSERRLLAKWGVTSLDQDPFRERSPFHLVKSLSTKAIGWIPPMPDEVAIPIFNKVAWWLGQPAEDVINVLAYLTDPLAVMEIEVAVGRYRSIRKKSLVGEKLRRSRNNKFIADFVFSTLPGESAPWHEAFKESYEGDKVDGPHPQIRRLFEAVREACAICIQGMTGMRISELLGIEAGFDPVSGLPKCVRMELSASGLYDVFLIRTVLSKTETGLPREMDWVLGMRPKGSIDEPLPVRALRLLNRLHEPWREHAKTTHLILAGLIGMTLPVKTTALGEMKVDPMRAAMKRFVSRWVDLSGLPDESLHKIKDNDLIEWRESKGEILMSHMLRKSWAQFMFAVDPNLMPAIQLQFHHLSMAMTDTGYIGSNMSLLNDMESVATQARNLMILESVLGRNPLAGRMGEEVEQASQKLAAQVKRLPTSDAYKIVLEFCEHAQLPIFFSPHGVCMPMKTHEMRCHDEAGTSLLLRKRPNTRTRQPSLCAGCGCFILDARHADFWAARYLDNWLVYKRAQRNGDANDYKVIKERGEQAGRLLKKIGVRVEHLDRQIEKTLEAEHVPV